MKHTTRMLSALAAIILSLSTSVYAENTAPASAAGTAEQQNSGYSYQGTANELYSIGILKGDGTNFNLEQMPDRLQSAVMTVRMLGKEAEALAQYESGEITCIFTDVSDAESWAKPYLAWLYANGITLGIGDGKFGNGACTAQMYCTFMLRALGYRDTGDSIDFSWEQALSFAAEKDLYNAVLEEAAFDRGSMAAVTYQTLAADLRGEERSLLEKLSQDGAVPAEGAEAILAKLSVFDQLDAQLHGIKVVPQTSAAGTFAVSTAVKTVENETTVSETYMQYHANLIYQNTDAAGEALAMTGTMNLLDTDLSAELPFGIWMKDGVIYSDMYHEQTWAQMETQSPLRSLLGTAAEDGSVASPLALPYYAVDNLYVEDTAEALVVSFDVSHYLAPTAVSMFGLENANGDLPTNAFDISAEYTIDKATGAVQNYKIRMLMGLRTEKEDGIISTQYHQMAYDINLEMGTEEQIVYPEFAEYKQAPISTMPLDMLALPF